MEAERIRLVDDQGGALDPRLARVLIPMRLRLARQFPSCRDEATAADVLEEAAHRLARRERRFGPIEKLHGYAWVTIRSVITSRLRRADARLTERLARSPRIEAVLATRGATTHTAAELERQVLVQQVLAMLSPGERRVCTMKAAGYSTIEIGRELGRSAVSVDTLYSRAKAKARRRCGHARTQKPSASAPADAAETVSATLTAPWAPAPASRIAPRSAG